MVYMTNSMTTVSPTSITMLPACPARPTLTESIYATTSMTMKLGRPKQAAMLGPALQVVASLIGRRRLKFLSSPPKQFD